MTCHVCGSQRPSNACCENGHYVCDACHRESGVDFVIETCRLSGSRDPIALVQSMMRDKSIYPNGPEHHSMVGAALLAAYANSGGEIDLDGALEELRARSLQVPGGTCGYWGCCGAAMSAGQFYSIVSGATPLTADPWARSARLTSRIMGRLADIGGPRCCKRTSFTAILEAAAYVAETDGVRMDVPTEVVCTFMSGNAECKREACPYFPKRVER